MLGPAPGLKWFISPELSPSAGLFMVPHLQNTIEDKKCRIKLTCKAFLTKALVLRQV